MLRNHKAGPNADIEGLRNGTIAFSISLNPPPIIAGSLFPGASCRLSDTTSPEALHRAFIGPTTVWIPMVTLLSVCISVL